MTDTDKCPARHLPNALLPNWEIRLYFFAWISTLLYAIYSVYGLSFETFLPMIQDDMDHHWSFLKDTLSEGILLWMLGHVLLGQALREKFWHVRSLPFLLYSVAFTVWCIGVNSTLFLLAQITIISLLAWITASPFVVWSLSLLCMCNNFGIQNRLELSLFKNTPPRGNYESLMFSQFTLKMLSFALSICTLRNQARDHKRKPNKVEKTEHVFKKAFEDTLKTSDVHRDDSLNSDRPLWLFLDGFCYIFYVPLSILGPLMTFDIFFKQFHQPYEKWTFARLRPIITGFSRVLFWGLILEFAKHFLYTSIMMEYLGMLRHVPLDTLISVSHLFVFIFTMKYVVLYTFTGSVARLDDIDPPKAPLCIGRVSCYSQVWKSFDRGFNIFVKTHIYIPLGGNKCGALRQLTSTCLSFLFMFLYHGAHWVILFWIFINICDVQLEMFAHSVSCWPRVKIFETSHFSAAMSRRIRSLCIAPCIMASTFALYAFMSSETSGYIVFNRMIIEGFPVSPLLVMAATYCMVQAAKEIENWEESRCTRAVKKD